MPKPGNINVPERSFTCEVADSTMAGRKRKPTAAERTDARRSKQPRAATEEVSGQEPKLPSEDQPGPSGMTNRPSTSAAGMVAIEEDGNAPNEGVGQYVGVHSTPQQELNEGMSQTPQIVDSAAYLARAIEDTLRSVREASMGETNSRFVNRLTSAGKLPSFSGDPLEWKHFEQSYRLTTELGAYSDRENMARLFAALKGEARDAVSTLFATGQDAHAVMRTLELNFGNKNVVAQRILNDIKGLPHLDTAQVNITQFATKLRNAVVAFRSLNLIGYLHSPDLIRNIGDKLPSALKCAYSRYSVESSSENSPLEKLPDFLYAEAEFAVEAGVFNMDVDCATSSRVAIAPQQLRRSKDPKCPTRRVLTVHAFEGRGKGGEKCVFCNKANHDSEHCREFARESMSRRWYLVKKHKLCFNCLRKGHPRDKCRRANCPICNGKHNSLLHNPKYVIKSKNAEQGTGRREQSFPGTSTDSGNSVNRP